MHYVFCERLMAASERNISESFRSIEERKLFLGMRGRDGMFIAMVAFFMFITLWPLIGTFYAAVAIAVITSLEVIALVRLYSHSPYWFEYTFGRSAYKNETWVA